VSIVPYRSNDRCCLGRTDWENVQLIPVQQSPSVAGFTRIPCASLLAVAIFVANILRRQFAMPLFSKPVRANLTTSTSARGATHFGELVGICLFRNGNGLGQLGPTEVEKWIDWSHPFITGMILSLQIALLVGTQERRSKVTANENRVLLLWSKGGGRFFA